MALGNYPANYNPYLNEDFLKSLKSLGIDTSGSTSMSGGQTSFAPGGSGITDFSNIDYSTMNSMPATLKLNNSTLPNYALNDTSKDMGLFGKGMFTNDRMQAGGSLLKGLGSIGQAYFMMKNLDLNRDELNQVRDEYQTNLANSSLLLNNDIRTNNEFRKANNMPENQNYLPDYKLA